MKKRTRNSLLAMTTVAWLGQPVAADPPRTEKTPGATGQISSAAADAPDIRAFTTGERALLASLLRDPQSQDPLLRESGRTSTSVAEAGTQTLVRRGDHLSRMALFNARTLPAATQDALATAPADTQTLIIGRQLVRLALPLRQVVDTLHIS